MEKLSFKNSEGLMLSARIEFPADRKTRSLCNFRIVLLAIKTWNAVKNIVRALASKGFAVLSFDFTGLGSSEGDFAETNFSSNIADLICAASALEEKYEAPKLLVGHSLGIGAAAIFAAKAIDSIEAVATVGAPSSPDHVAHLFEDHLDEIKNKAEAKVLLGGRPFTIKRQFLLDINSKNMAEIVKS